MKMRFSLATLLHLRELREEQERVKLAAANLRKVGTQQEAERLEALLKEASRRSVAAEGDTHGAQMNFVQECCAVLGIHERRAKVQAEAAKADAMKQEEVYLGVHREFEVMESYRESQAEIFHRMELRQNQKELDEAYVLAHAQQSRQGLPSGSADLAHTTPALDKMDPQEDIGKKE